MIRKANISDVTKIQELIKTCAKSGEVLPRSLNNIYENLRDFFVFEKDGRIVGCCALHITWDDLAEIRSLVVEASVQGQGIGKKLIEASIKETQAFKIRKVFLLTEKLDFFKKMGFIPTDKSLLPHKIWSDCVHCIHFPNCNEEAMIMEV
ncbi:MAG: N-acetyltransferase [Candidatus Omnitrophota bacterium]